MRNLNSLYDRMDDIDDVSDHLDFIALLYPVISMQCPYNVTVAYDNIIEGERNPNKDEDEIKFSPHLHVTQDTPPMFIAHANDDNLVPVMNSVLMYQATLNLNAPILPHSKTHSDEPSIPVKVKSMLTIYQSGGHGFGLGHREDMTHLWPDSFLQWLKLNQFLRPHPINDSSCRDTQLTTEPSLDLTEGKAHPQQRKEGLVHTTTR